MTLLEAKEYLCQWTDYLRKVFFDESGTTYTEPNVDCIANLETTGSRGLGKKWNYLTTYQAGDIITYAYDIYLSLTTNLNKSPISYPSDWTKLNMNQLEVGTSQVRAWLYYQANDPSVDEPQILKSYNIESVSKLTVNTFQVFFASSANITDTNYLVQIQGQGDKPVRGTVYDKSTTSFKVVYCETSSLPLGSIADGDYVMLNIAII